MYIDNFINANPDEYLKRATIRDIIPDISKIGTLKFTNEVINGLIEQMNVSAGYMITEEDEDYEDDYYGDEEI